LNSVNLIGRLVQDPELRYTPAGGVAVANFTLAVDRPFLNQKGERERILFGSSPGESLRKAVP